jgi:HPt (histidine-containing phosphotransfer) domain-containing protein
MNMTSINHTAFDELKQISGAEFINELIDTFLEDAPKMMQEIHEAQATADADAFRRAAHSLKSNAATFGAGGLAELAKELETLGRENRLGDIGDRLNVLNEALTSACDELRGLKS